MTLEQRINDVVTRIATEFKLVKSKMTGNNVGDLAGLNTADKSSLLAAINETNTKASAAIPLTQKGVAGGVASLDGTGKVPAAQLPGYVDDVLEYANLVAFPAVGETGKLYLALDTNLVYRWSGSAYVKVADSAVASVFGRTGAVVAANGDYATSQVTNNSTVAGATAKDALETVAASAANAAAQAAIAQAAAAGSVRFDQGQALTAGQKAQAKANIDAYGNLEIGNPDTDFVAAFNTALA